MSCRRLLTNISSDHLTESRDFYVQLLDFKIGFDSDWFVQLQTEDAAHELGIIRRDHELLPAPYQAQPGGVYVTFVVDDVDVTYRKALEMELEILQAPRNEFYGQRRFLTVDPGGCLVDISSPY